MVNLFSFVMETSGRNYGKTMKFVLKFAKDTLSHILWILSKISNFQFMKIFLNYYWQRRISCIFTGKGAFLAYIGPCQRSAIKTKCYLFLQKPSSKMLSSNIIFWLAVLNLQRTNRHTAPCLLNEVGYNVIMANDLEKNSLFNGSNFFKLALNLRWLNLIQKIRLHWIYL